jgi:hypothetical protein
VLAEVLIGSASQSYSTAGKRKGKGHQALST